MGDDTEQQQLIRSSASESDSEIHGSISQEIPPTTVTTDGSPRRTKWQTRIAFFTVILTEGLERMAFYSLVCNMVLFLNSEPLHWASYHAAMALFTLNGLSYVATLFGGWVADALLGKYTTISIAFLVYIAGICVWPVLYPNPKIKFTACNQTYDKWNNHWCAGVNKSAVDWTATTIPGTTQANTPVSLGSENCAWVVFVAITVLSLGYGSVRVNIIPFGAHQVEHEGQVAMRFYFNWLYWFINVGSLIAFGVMGYIQQDISFFYGYLMPGIILIIAFLIFLSGSRFYTKKHEAHGSILTNIFCICRNAVKVSCHENRRRDIEILTSEIPRNTRVPCCLDYAKTRHGGQFSDQAVDDIKALGRIVLVYVAMIPYWTVYYQMQTTFMVQGLHMKLDFNFSNSTEQMTSTFQIPASWLIMFDVVFVLLLLPILDRIIYPRLDRAGRSPSLRLRILIGMFFTVAAMCVAGVVENYRLRIYWNGSVDTPDSYIQYIGCTRYRASRMSILWQMPQYALVGISEIFTSTAGLELAYIAAPQSMKGIIMGLYWFCQGIGSLLGTATMAIFEGVWFPNDFDYGNINCNRSPFQDKREKCHLDYYFYFMAGFQFLGILLFIAVAWLLDIGRSVPLRVQEQGVTVVRSSESATRPQSGTQSLQDVSSSSPILNHLQRRNADSRSSKDMSSRSSTDD